MIEIIIDHSILGTKLEDNIVVVAACNPSRKVSVTQGGIFRENDLGKDWASGHYQVKDLPVSMKNLKWSYGSLNSEQEKEFIERRIEMVGNSIPTYLWPSFASLISTAQEAIRSFAAPHIMKGLKRVNCTSISDIDTHLRARSVVSLRDIQRVFRLCEFFLSDFAMLSVENQSIRSKCRRAILLSLAVVYYLRLDDQNRLSFLKAINLVPAEQCEEESFIDILFTAMDFVTKETIIENGIALTRGLKGEVFRDIYRSFADIFM